MASSESPPAPCPAAAPVTHPASVGSHEDGSQAIDFQARLARPERFEPPSLRFVVAAEVLRRQIETVKADLVVTGLFGRSRLRETVLSGVSRSLPGDPPAALLVSH